MGIELQRVSVVGLGRLGAPMAACFAFRGFPTVGLDTDPAKIQAINQRKAPIFEPGLEELVRKSEGRLTAGEDYEAAIRDSDVTFLVVPTPSEETGGFSLRYALQAGERLGAVLRTKPGFHLVVLTSTVMPGATGGQLKPLLEARSGKTCGKEFGLCYGPEFIALGSVIRDFLNPDFILIGESDPASGEALAHLYKRVCANDPPIARMSFVNAELTKLAVNTFVTTKITFANMIARICERLPGANVDVVTSALGLDSRIGRKYLKGGIGYGGPCFPRDNAALIHLARGLDAPATLAEATDSFNRNQVHWLATLAKSHLPEGGSVGILGLTYKPDSNTVEEAQGLLLAQILAADSIPVVAYDPVGMDNARKVLGEGVTLSTSAADCVRQADVLVVTTPWADFKKLSVDHFGRNSNPRILIDCWRVFDNYAFSGGVKYVPLGIGKA
jgi:UDPglucose 6-dehydrogenase